MYDKTSHSRFSSAPAGDRIRHDAPGEGASGRVRSHRGSRRKRARDGICRVLLSLAVFLAAAPVHAHKVNIFAFAEGQQVFVEGYFSDGKRAQNSVVKVFSPEGAELLSGTTDDQGSFTFTVPQTTDLRITLNAGMGHQTEYTLTRAELAGGESVAGSDAGGGQAEGVGVDPPPATGAVPASPATEAMVRRAVAQGLIPVVRGLSELKERRGFSDIVGGIGFIFGIVGVVFYLKARRLAGRSSSGQSGQ